MAGDEQAKNQSNPQLQGYPPTAGYGPAEDEIDLADLAAVLFRWKWVIIGLTLIFGCAAFGATSVMTEKYRAETILQIGQVPVPERSVSQIKQGTINIEMKTREEAAAEKLRGFARQVFANPPFKGSTGFSLQNDLAVSASEDGGGIVEIRLKAPRSADPLDFLTRLNEKLIKDHEQMIHMDRASLNSRITETKNRIKEHQAKKSSFLKRIERLKKEASFLKQELETVREQLSRLVQAVHNAGAAAAGEPLETFLLGTELHRPPGSDL
ncbi:LPS O-antigen subunit length determinant protein (WzzB/FepE family) [Desulfosalsimonas propionicica]|uniref:LPS O-antigen subunit length determinant protein (WzzB/FepE family) n=1 Tax=Desulfosalsimonas propionicica TaxID=332175 RepID=A0A7W0CBI5_9BACT|nr:Wzz/FepE/Etk N-terminal domain-containing protein [Desulfosalsimonas propionicica]MBA2882653.1 LPS O-antigen subunit length determinant protein (WzzB/FepE family) [Desulfosalsimonas propionicica]